MLNENKIHGKWMEIKGDIQKSWGKLTDNELEKTKGDFNALSGLIQQRYGDDLEKNKKKLTDTFKHFEDKKDDAIHEIKNKLKK